MDDQNLPPSYGKTRLVLLAVDPYLIHAYWEVTPERLIESKEQAGEAQSVLRLYKDGSGAEEDPAEWFDVDVDLKTRSWYVHLWSAEESYRGDLGLKKRDGALIRLARSEPVRMPRAQPAIAVDEHFMRVDPTERRAEIVPPPQRAEQPPDSVASPTLNQISSPHPIPRAVDYFEIVRRKLERLYATLRWPAKGGAESDIAAVPRVRPGQAAFDLTDMAEARLAGTTSSEALQRVREGGESDQKK
jgi:hypothetical protein